MHPPNPNPYAPEQDNYPTPAPLPTEPPPPQQPPPATLLRPRQQAPPTDAELKAELKRRARDRKQRRRQAEPGTSAQLHARPGFWIHLPTWLLICLTAILASILAYTIGTHHQDAVHLTAIAQKTSDMHAKVEDMHRYYLQLKADPASLLGLTKLTDSIPIADTLKKHNLTGSLMDVIIDDIDPSPDTEEN